MKFILLTLGFTWLFLHYLLPVVIGLVLILIGIFLFNWAYKKFYDPLGTVNLNNGWVLVLACLILIVILIATVG